LADRLPEPIFTPATKAAAGHDENVTYATLADAVGAELAATLRDRTLDLYRRAARHAAAKGLLLADTKFEFGHAADGTLLLADEALTPDSSRYWPADQWRPGVSPPSFDKQYVRDWLEGIGYDKQSVPPPLPEEVAAKTREKYAEACRRLAGVSW
jgi:phosphoribosylaminoimidazole-succinocarboxamide synthase